MGKKLLFVAAMFWGVVPLNAQNLPKNSVDLVLGFTTSVCSEKYDNAIVGFTLGLDIRHTLAVLKNEKTSVYVLTGMHYVRKGGKTTTDISKWLDNDVNLICNQIQIPLHGGLNFKFNKCSLYLDVGPYLGATVSEDTDNDKNAKIETSEFGYGVNLGIRFKHFGIGFGSEQGLTNFGKYSNNKGTLKSNETLNFTNTIGHIDLRWTF